MIVTVPDCTGVDTSGKLTPAMARALAGSSWQGAPIRFVFRYVPLPGNAGHGDIDPGELEAIIGAGLMLGLVQHCRLPGWAASGMQGTLDGKAASYAAKLAGYQLGAHLAFDLEGCRDSGAPVAAHVNAWAAEVSAAGYEPLLYVGYAAGLGPAELYDLPLVNAYWSDYGPRSVATRGFCLRQHAQTALAGITVDPDVATADVLGGRLLLMGREPAPTDPAPAT